ncbi:M48 family metallopeptidase [Robertkochia solimangrovi]|uniref:M48 family metallopeptidase n=1 Tax=Robertkochia solimangrovi TaxID=2213046 RepID=UPI00117E61D8|nr:M48 family metallopeptidase [Robertkochia solimangrovi]TRZ43606.1 M48 family peptidase [Robertkochia solimangrovi]
MNVTIIYYIITGILILDFVIDQVLDYLNYTRFDSSLPKDLEGIYDEETYKNSQVYKKTNYRFSVIHETFSLLLILLMLRFSGFGWIDNIARNTTEHPIGIALIFFGIIMFAGDLLNLPFSIYKTFVIEERFGFNKTSVKTFVLDKIKGWVLGAVLGGGILSLIILFFEKTGTDFWIYAWILITVITLFTNMFYSRWIVPIFNKQTPLEDGSLRSKIEKYSKEVGFNLEKIFVIDGSKRSSKANAYFSGFGKEKRITLYDTLIKDLDEEEIVAVLAHEVGHYKRRHIIFNIVLSVVLTGITLYLLSLFISIPELSLALGVSTPGFHTGLIAFALLYSPISEITGLFMNWVSRKFEYQADDYAKTTYSAAPLINALKRLSRNNLSNLTPHPAYVFMHYSHPTLLQRIRNLKA